MLAGWEENAEAVTQPCIAIAPARMAAYNCRDRAMERTTSATGWVGSPRTDMAGAVKG